MKINQILANVDQHTICVPAFQREYVWGKEDAKKLVSSLLQDYPVGTLLTWTTHNPPELKGKCKEHAAIKGATKIILDGQQRVTTLYMLVTGDIPPYYAPEEITHDVRGLYVNLENLELQYHNKSLMAKNPMWVDITDIFKGKIRPLDIIKKHTDTDIILTDELQNTVWDNLTRIINLLNYEMAEQVVPVTANIREAIDIFYVVNASGVNLTDAELALAQISGYWPEAREIFKKKLSELEAQGFKYPLDFIVYALLAVVHNMGSDMRRLHDSSNLENLQLAWTRLSSRTLDYTFNIMQQSAYIDHSKEINSSFALLPIIVYCYRKDKEPLSHKEIGKMVKWFFYSQLRNRYISQLGQKLDKDIKVVVTSDSPFDDLLSAIRAERNLEISPDEFRGATVRSPLWNLMRWYFKSKGAVCFTTGVSIRKPMGYKYALEWDHVFAFAQLRNLGYGYENQAKYALAQEITNRIVLTQTANRSKSDELAENYLLTIKEKYPKALELQAIPLDEKLWKIENFEEFLLERRQMLADQLNRFLESIADDVETDTSTPIDEMITFGESSELEFKSTLRWNLRSLSPDKRLEHSVLKTIAAFNNSDGGTLIIGVSDDGEVLGLDNDYTTLNGGRDEFELHLRNLVKQQIGTSFVTINTPSVSFEEIEGLDVCRVEIAKGRKPVYLKQDNITKFYVRNGNSTIDIEGTDQHEYTTQRFAAN